MKRLGLRAGAIGACAALVALGASLGTASCSSNPTNVPVRTFERPGRVDVVCMQVADTTGGVLVPVPAKPVVQSKCAPVPPNTDTSSLPFHLFALVTQTTRGEVAVVDLTAGVVIDEDRQTPGINFIPVGANPTDLAVTPDGALTFVGAAEPNKFAIYAIPNARALGDSQPLPSAQILAPLALPDLPSCALPQAPGPLVMVPRGAGAYELIAVLPGAGKVSAKVVTIDPAPFLAGAGLDGGSATPIAPGSLGACPIKGAIELSPARPTSWTPGPAWDDGVPYANVGSLAATEPPLGGSCAAPPIPPADAGTGEGGEGGTGVDAGSADAGTDAADASLPLNFGPPDPPLATAAALALNTDHPTLYVADGSLPIIHIIDLSQPGAPKELFPPLLATSVGDPARKVSVGSLAVSPTTHDFKRFLYAIDRKDGSIIVYDITDPVTSPRVPLERPHPEINPFQPADRLSFVAPVAAVSFVRHDFPLTQTGLTPLNAAKTGLICNPNPNAGSDPSFGPTDEALGAFYRANVTNQPVALGPSRLRGVFAFATLSNGQVIIIDVDDWDAPCRRPDPMSSDHVTSDVAPPQPVASAGDVNPYHAPSAAGVKPISTPVTLESFFPVSAPHRTRSQFYLRQDLQGSHIPVLAGRPQLVDATNAPKGTDGDEGNTNPIMLPTLTRLEDPTYVKAPQEPDPSARGSTITQGPQPTDAAFSLPARGNTLPGVRIAWEDPLVHFDQDWTVTYEGALPNLDGLALSVDSVDDYRTLSLSAKNPLLCRRGIEDARLAKQRVAAEKTELARLHLPDTRNAVTGIAAEQWTGDYVQLTEDILAPDHPYWKESGDSCWEGDFARPDNASGRYQVCQDTYGTADTPEDLAKNIARDFPILEAYDDHLVIGRFGYTDPSAIKTTNRIIVGGDASNVAALKRMRCCFHHLVRFNVRTGGRWLALGSNSGYLHHVTTDAATGACVQSCAPRDALLNARAPEITRPGATDGAAAPPDRSSPLAMRNPSFSFVMWGAVPPDTTDPKKPPVFDHTKSTRDLVWKFTTRGQFVPYVVNIATASTAVSPQSMRFIDSLGQLAVVDGASQGLILIDLNNIALAHAPYF